MLGEAYKHLEENIWRVIGDVTPKVQGLLEARFKKLKAPNMLAAPVNAFATARPQTAMMQQQSQE